MGEFVTQYANQNSTIMIIIISDNNILGSINFRLEDIQKYKLIGTNTTNTKNLSDVKIHLDTNKNKIIRAIKNLVKKHY